jgi:hypothetical protein
MRTTAALGALLILSGLAGCSSAPEPAASPPPTKAPAAPEPPKDHTSLFPDAGKVSTSVVADHILGLKALPGGSWAEYNVKGKKYQEFIIDTDSTQAAAFMMLDVKAQLANPQYISWMGGYFGMLGDQQVYCYSKTHYVAGVVGLPEDKADPLARTLAAQLH